MTTNKKPLYRTLLLTVILMQQFSLHLLAADDGKEVKKAVKQMKADVQTVKGWLKTERDQEKNLAKGEGMLQRLIADTLFSNDLSLRVLLSDVVKREYEIVNEKVYLKQNVDTAGLMNAARKMFLVCYDLDSLDVLPNAKGVSAPAYRRRNAEYLMPYRGNIFKGGLYFYSHGKWREAWQMLDTYLDCHKRPLFEEVPLDSTNDTYAAYVAFEAADHLGDYPMALKYAEQALTYEPAYEATLVSLAELSNSNGDTLRYADCLLRGFRHAPKSQYFFPRIIDYYTDRAAYSKAMEIADEALLHDAEDELFLLAKHSLLMDTRQYDEALEYGKRLLAVNDSLAQPNYNVGYVIYLRAKDAMKQAGKTYRQRIKEAQKQYRLCLPYMERYRALCPEDRQRWRTVLYDVYLNLNMGKEFSEIEKE